MIYQSLYHFLLTCSSFLQSLESIYIFCLLFWIIFLLLIIIIFFMSCNRRCFHFFNLWADIRNLTWIDGECLLRVCDLGGFWRLFLIFFVCFVGILTKLMRSFRIIWIFFVLLSKHFLRLFFIKLHWNSRNLFFQRLSDFSGHFIFILYIWPRSF